MIFAFVARLAIWLLPHGLVREIVVIIDDVVLIGLLLYFGWDMFIYLWNRRAIIQPHTATGAPSSLPSSGPSSCAEIYLPARLAKPLGEIAQALTRLIPVPW